MDKPNSPNSRLTVILSSALCVLVLAAVVYGAMKGREGADAPSGITDRAPPRTPGSFSDPTGCGSVDPEHPPKIEVLLPQTGLDFGPIKQGVRIAREVQFRNVGQGTLCVMRVETGCGCLKAKLANTRVKRFGPGETGTIIVTLDSTDREGEISKTVKITTNDIDAPIKEFPARADVSRAVIVAPARLLFGRRPRLTPVDGVVTVRSPKDDPEWTVVDVVGTRRTRSGERIAYTFEVKPVEDARFRVFSVTIHHPGIGDEGKFRDPLIIKTTHSERPEIALQSFLEVVARISARPARVSLGFIRSGTTRPAARVRLLPGGLEVEFEITAVEVVPRADREPGPGGPGFVATFGSDNAGAWVDVQYDGKSRKGGLLEAVVVVHTSDAEMPEVRIPVSTTIRTSSR